MRKATLSLAALVSLILTWITVLVYAQEPSPTLPPALLEVQPAVIIGIFVGTLARLLFPYWAKLKAASESPTPVVFKFDVKYVYIAIVNIVQSAVLTTLALQNAPPLAGFLAALSWAYMSQDLFSRQI